MADQIYKVRDPQGNMREIKGPAGASDEEVIARAKELFGEPAPQQAERGPDPSVNAGMAGVGSLIDAATFGLGTRAVDAVIGQLPGHTYAGERAATEQLQQDHPIASTVGAVGGSLAGGAGLENLAVNGLEKAAPGLLKGGRALLTLKKGEAAANAARIAGAGALSGALYGGVSGGIEGARQNGVEGAAYGAPVGAAAGAALGGVTGIGAALVGKGIQFGLEALAPAEQRGIKKLADEIGMTPNEYVTAAKQFRAVTGRMPTPADILNERGKVNLEAVTTAKHQASQLDMQAADRANAEALQRALPKQIVNGQPTETAARIDATRKAAFDSAIGPIAGEHVNLPTKVDPKTGADVIDLPPKLHRAIADDVRANADPQAEALLEKGIVTLRTVDNVRKSLNDRHNTKPGHNLNTLSAQITELGDAAVGGQYRAMLDEYASFSRGLKGFETGHGNIDPATLTGPANRDAPLPDFAAGNALGQRARLAEAAGKSEAGAAQTADTLRQLRAIPGPQGPSPVLGALGEKETARLQRLGAAEKRSQDNYAFLAGNDVVSRTAKAAQAAQLGAEGAAALGGHAMTGFKVHTSLRWAQALGLRESTAKEVVRLLTTRAATPKDITALAAKLKLEGVREGVRRRILQNLATPAGRVGGLLGGKLAAVYAGYPGD